MASKKIVVGKWGGSAGTEWDDGSYTGIRQIDISYRDAIGTIKVIYDLNGQCFRGLEHASTIVFPNNDTIVLDFPAEYITSVSGYTGPLPGLASNDDVIRYLKIETNTKIVKEYGVKEGTPFNLPIENGLIVGFKGITGQALSAIGFHLAF